jgi:hypothetical protein
MATNPRTSQVDNLLDDVQLTRVELHGKVQNARTLVLRIRHMERELYDELMDIERELSGADDQSPGGELFQKVVDLRSHKSIRRRTKWDGTPRRKSDREGRHLEAVA